MPEIENLPQALTSIFGGFKPNEPLSHHTTMRVGGPARYFVAAHHTTQIEQAIAACKEFGVPFFILGWGSNVVVSDSGVPGLVIQNRAQNWCILEAPALHDQKISKTAGRFKPVGEEYYTTTGLEYSDEDSPVALVRVESGAKIGPLMNALFREGITGLQWFAGIPATVGGAIYMNMHGGPHFFGELVEQALLCTDHALKAVDQGYFEFEYDYSILHETKEIVLQADLRLRRGDVARAKEIARTWAARKSLQPQISAGCIFRNLTKEEQNRLNLPTSSIGYLIDHVLKLKGERRGDAIISPGHAAFIENLGHATAADVKALIDLIREKAKTDLDLDLVAEVELIGEF